VHPMTTPTREGARPGCGVHPRIRDGEAPAPVSRNERWNPVHPPEFLPRALLADARHRVSDRCDGGRLGPRSNRVKEVAAPKARPVRRPPGARMTGSARRTPAWRSNGRTWPPAWARGSHASRIPEIAKTPPNDAAPGRSRRAQSSPASSASTVDSSGVSPLSARSRLIRSTIGGWVEKSPFERSSNFLIGLVK
jgi:hypothetical protein